MIVENTHERALSEETDSKLKVKPIEISLFEYYGGQTTLLY